MAFVDRIRHCNSYDPARAIPLWAGEHRIGWLRRDNAKVLARHDTVFRVTEDVARLLVEGSCDEISRAVEGVVDILVAERRVPKWRNETFDVMPRWGEPPIFRLDRGAVPFFGVRAYGVHLNGFVGEGAAMRLWIGRRATNKLVAPGKLDNLVAGGISCEHGLYETLVKESEEEACIPHEFVARAVPVGAVSYRMENKLGVRNDVLFVYDLDVPPGFTPRNSDGEIVEFSLMPAAEAVERVRAGDDFKFNVNLVIIDFALRHGLVSPDDPDYLDLVVGLRRPL